jgi:oligopeptidase B
VVVDIPLTAASGTWHVVMPGKRTLKKVKPVLGGFSKDDYTTERLWATAADGTKVPISLVYRNGLAKKDGSDPMLLHG